jgi:23S rRNA (cytidine1920-2'-O)/16S rRNA (cytidine1409-2'-O)-methyltransferase
VYAVDVGRGQLAWKLRTDDRVSNLERTDIRELPPLPEPVELAVVDVSFISLRLVLPAVQTLLSPDGRAVVLVKPQFEAGRRQVGRGGIVRDRAVHRAVLEQTLSVLRRDRWKPAGLVRATITGARGNQEYFLLLGMPGSQLPGISDPAALAQAGLLEEPPAGGGSP